MSDYDKALQAVNRLRLTTSDGFELIDTGNGKALVLSVTPTTERAVCPICNHKKRLTTSGSIHSWYIVFNYNVSPCSCVWPNNISYFDESTVVFKQEWDRCVWGVYATVGPTYPDPKPYMLVTIEITDSEVELKLICFTSSESWPYPVPEDADVVFRGVVPRERFDCTGTIVFTDDGSGRCGGTAEVFYP